MSTVETLAIPRGFRAAAVKAGIKESGNLDLSVLAADGILCGRRHVHDEPDLCRTGEVVPRASAVRGHPSHRDQFGECQRGDRCAGVRQRRNERPPMRRSLLGCRPEQVLVASTGVIGHQLPMDKIEAGLDQAIPRLSPDPDGFSDRRHGHHDHRLRGPSSFRSAQTIGGREVTLLGMAKGAAMIGPRMATMLAFLLTDAPVWANDLHDILGNGRRPFVQLPLGRGTCEHQRHGPHPLEHGWHGTDTERRRTYRHFPGWSNRPACRSPA